MPFAALWTRFYLPPGPAELPLAAGEACGGCAEFGCCAELEGSTGRFWFTGAAPVCCCPSFSGFLSCWTFGSSAGGTSHLTTPTPSTTTLSPICTGTGAYCTNSGQRIVFV